MWDDQLSKWLIFKVIDSELIRFTDLPSLVSSLLLIYVEIWKVQVESYTKIHSCSKISGIIKLPDKLVMKALEYDRLGPFSFHFENRIRCQFGLLRSSCFYSRIKCWKN